MNAVATETRVHVDDLDEAAWWGLVDAAAAGADVPGEVLHALAQSAWVEGRVAAAGHDATSERTKRALAGDADPLVRRAVARGSYPEELSERFVADPDDGVFVAWVVSRHTTPEVLLSARSHCHRRGGQEWIEGSLHDRLVREVAADAVAFGATDEEAVLRYCGERFAFQSAWVAVAQDYRGYRERTPIEHAIVQEVSRSIEEARRSSEMRLEDLQRLDRVANDPNVSESLLDGLAEGTDPDTRYVAACHGQTRPDVWARLCTDADPQVRTGARLSSHARPAFLSESTRSDDPASVAGAVLNERTPLKDLALVARLHPDPDLRSMAGEVFAHRLATRVARTMDETGVTDGVDPRLVQDLTIAAVVNALGEEAGGVGHVGVTPQEIAEQAYAQVGIANPAAANVVALRPRM